ncbi:Ig-like domain-containing protein [Cellulomonas sp. S1-8]|nr:Ig-like domain-containing protein [Cellulomonas sp. S1-8]
MRSSYAFPADGIVDEVESFSVDPYDPPLWFESNIGADFVSQTFDGATVAVHGGPGAADADVLVLHHLNGTGDRAQVVGVTVPDVIETTTTLDVESVWIAGEETLFQMTVSPREATGTFTLYDGDTELGTTEVVDGAGVWSSYTLGAGPHLLRAQYTPDTPLYAPSSSPVVEIELAPSASTTTLKVTPAVVRYGQPAVATVTVTGQSWAPSGPVTIRERGRVVATADLTVDGLTGTATIELPRNLRVGTHPLVAVFEGTADVEASQGTSQVRVIQGYSTATLTTESWTVPSGSTPTVTVRVDGGAGSPPATGRVVVLLGVRPVGYYTLVDGAAAVRLPAVRSSTVVTVLYLGDDGYLPTATARVLRVG